MGGKKLLIMCMFLFLVLGINTIYASDINDTQTINAATESDEIDKLSVSGDNDKLSVNEYTFQNLEDKIDATNEGGTLNLSADDLYKNTDSYSVNGIVISKNITINGNGATIDGNNVGRIFNITANNVVLKNLTFINGYAFRGGAIFSENLKIYDCNFINNSAIMYGGAIDGADHLNITVYNSYFRNNSATNETLSYGGAICSKYAHIYNSTFEFNSAINGGAINGVAEVFVFNSTFVNNTAKQSGGAVASLLSLNVDNSTFINNTAYLYGGAIHVLYGAEISNSNFFMNKAITFDGGAVRVNSLTVKTSNFVNNSAYRYGGAIFGNIGATVEKSNFTQNNAQFGGAVSSRKIKADDLIFRNNTANAGGVIFSDNIEVKNSLIMSNKAQKGGAICIDVTSSSNVILEGCVIYNNIADSGFEIDTFNDVDLPKSNLNGNWWGNTILNLKDRPNVSAAFNLTNWVYLDMELDIPTIKLNEDENITLVLSHLANETGKLNINHTISLVHFNLTSTGGSINKDYLELPSGTGKFVYHVSESDNNAILGKFYEYNFKFPLYFAVPPVIQISRPDEILFKESGNITVTVVNATGFVNITVGSQVFNNVKLNNSKATVSVKGLVLGENTINVTYGGDGYHLIGNASDKFNVVKNHVLPVILINCSNVIYVNEFNNITVLVVNGTGFVNITCWFSGV
ncbi:hypothetical protein [uncultured Methanobrevibacter sp.]|uniref:hypothetical protein n=1 Tax=uncultured Methanobrevibacter sp. TaxID=253161 RepID=UPI0025D630D9|nr:hypothetical protein [uncultured Methanobrevibacter sp.]